MGQMAHLKRSLSYQLIMGSMTDVNIYQYSQSIPHFLTHFFVHTNRRKKLIHSVLILYQVTFSYSWINVSKTPFSLREGFQVIMRASSSSGNHHRIVHPKSISRETSQLNKTFH